MEDAALKRLIEFKNKMENASETLESDLGSNDPNSFYSRSDEYLQLAQRAVSFSFYEKDEEQLIEMINPSLKLKAVKRSLWEQYENILQEDADGQKGLKISIEVAIRSHLPFTAALKHYLESQAITAWLVSSASNYKDVVETVMRKSFHRALEIIKQPLVVETEKTVIGKDGEYRTVIEKKTDTKLAKVCFDIMKHIDSRVYGDPQKSMKVSLDGQSGLKALSQGGSKKYDDEFLDKILASSTNQKKIDEKKEKIRDVN